MSTRAYILVVALALAVFAFIIRLVRTRQLRAKYSVLWFSIGVALVVVAAFPGLLETLSDALEIDYPPTLFLLLAAGFLFVLSLHFSWELSRLEDRTRTLAEEVALLRREVEALAADRVPRE